jgi:hypothetical protein
MFPYVIKFKQVKENIMANTLSKIYVLLYVMNANY